MTDYPANVPQSEELEILLYHLPPMAPELTEAVLNSVIEAYAGWLLPGHLKKELRNRQMMDEFDGTNVSQLCRRYRINRATFYRIREKELARKKMAKNKRLLK